MTTKQTAGHDALGEFAPEFAHINDDILFGEIWSREDKLPLKLRSIVTISALIGKGITDSPLAYHLASARKNGVTQQEMAEILTHLAFYAGVAKCMGGIQYSKGCIRRRRRQHRDERRRIPWWLFRVGQAKRRFCAVLQRSFLAQSRKRRRQLPPYLQCDLRAGMSQ